jgi:hypothetical protein
MIPDTETRKNPTRLNVGLKKKEDLKLEPTEAQNQDVTAEELLAKEIADLSPHYNITATADKLRDHLDEFIRAFNEADDLDPIDRLLALAEIERLRQAIATVERITATNERTHAL